MTPLQTRLLKRGALSLALITLVWALGPYLAIADSLPFGSLTSRLSATLVILLVWSLLAAKNLLDNRDPVRLSLEGSQKEIIQHFYREMRELIHRVNRLLPFHAFGSRKQPWVLLLGENQSGKTSLLAHSGITLSSPEDKSLTTVSPTQSIDWWVNNEVVFADPAGHYGLPRSEDPEKKILWRTFLKATKRYPWSRSFDAIILVLDLPSLVSQDTQKLQRLADQMQQQMLSVAEGRHNIPVTLLVTQCDQVYGFADFFNDLGPEEREQSFGFTLEEEQRKIPFNDFFKQRAERFIQRLNERLIWRMHQEQNLSSRARIRDFPSEMEQLTRVLEMFVNYFPSRMTQSIRGIYFSSSLQSEQSVNLLTHAISEKYQLAEIKTPALLVNQRPYFIHQFFKRVIEDTKGFIALDDNNNPIKKASLPVALAAILLGVFVWHFGYRQNVDALNAMTQSLMTASKDDISWLAKLNTLNNILKNPTQRAASHYSWVGLSQTGDLKKQAETTYNQLLETSFAHYLNQVLVLSLKQAIGDDPTDLYNTLEVYLMLAEPEHRNTQRIHDWFVALWQKQFPSNQTMRSNLENHLTHFLKLHHFAWVNSPSVVKRAQASLTRYPVDRIAFMLLQDQEKNEKPVSLFQGEESLPALDTSKATIPSLYTANHFKTVYQKKIPQVVRALSKGNWVIGKLDSPQLSLTERNELIEAVKLLYLKNAIQTWQIAIKKIKLNPPKTLSEAVALIHALQNENSPYWKLLGSTINNVTINSKDFSDLDQFIKKDKAYEVTQSALADLAQYLQKMMDAQTRQATYVAASKRMKKDGKGDPITRLLHAAGEAPEPINTWLTTLAQSSWHIMLEDSRDYLNASWQTNIIPPYNEHIRNRYPVFSESLNDISFSDFSHFFGPGGDMERFFNDYLQPFVNTKTFYWTWKTLDNEAMPIPQATLEMLIRASMIQRMFYQKGRSKPETRFSLQPIEFSANVSAVKLNLGGKTISDDANADQTHRLTWPGPDGDFVRLSFEATDQEQPSASISGEWAWFRLLADANLQSQGIHDPRSYTLVFQIGDHEAKYKLTSNARTNPFLPNVLSAFRCPPAL